MAISREQLSSHIGHYLFILLYYYLLFCYDYLVRFPIFVACYCINLQIQALNEELVSIDRQMSETVTVCDTLLAELMDDDKNRATAAVNDRSASVDR